MTVASVDSGDDDLVACVQDVLAPSPSRSKPRNHVTKVSTHLVFNNDQAAGPKPPPRPKSTKTFTSSIGRACLAADATVHEIRVPTLVVTNFDAARAPADSLVPDLRYACSPRNYSTD